MNYEKQRLEEEQSRITVGDLVRQLHSTLFDRGHWHGLIFVIPMKSDLIAQVMSPLITPESPRR